MSGECESCAEHAVDCCCPNKCIGVFGKWFGHNFKSYLIKGKFEQKPYEYFNVEGQDNVFKLVDSKRDTYMVRCKRCGCQL